MALTEQVYHCSRGLVVILERAHSRVSLFGPPTSLLSSRNKHLSVQIRDRLMHPFCLFCFARTGLITRLKLDLSPDFSTVGPRR
jgi:hypothetical protein